MYMHGIFERNKGKQISVLKSIAQNNFQEKLSVTLGLISVASKSPSKSYGLFKMLPNMYLKQRI